MAFFRALVLILFLIEMVKFWKVLLRRLRMVKPLREVFIFRREKDLGYFSCKGEMRIFKNVDTVM